MQREQSAQQLLIAGAVAGMLLLWAAKRSRQRTN
jgi:hypothetical protein